MRLHAFLTALALAAGTALTPVAGAFAAPGVEEINSADPVAACSVGAARIADERSEETTRRAETMARAAPGDEACEDTAAMMRLQVLLDRAGASVGPIDGVMGDATRGALADFQRMKELEADGELDGETWAALYGDTAPAAQSYAISAEDVEIELSAPIPRDFAEMAKRERLGYVRYSEALAEKFHMTEALLQELNPGADFSKPGTEIVVAQPAQNVSAEVARIEVLKDARRVRAYGADGKLVFSAPAAVGSEETPSPSGTMKVRAVAPAPNYTFDPKNIRGAETDEKVIVPPGPNGPVGSTWIDLAKPTYGIHGTPDPTGIFSAQSNGCVRLTNWDAEALSKLVKPEVTTVEFK